MFNINLSNNTKDELYNIAIEKFNNLRNMQIDDSEFDTELIIIIMTCANLINNNINDGDAHILLSNAYLTLGIHIPKDQKIYLAILLYSCVTIYHWKKSKLPSKENKNGETLYKKVTELIFLNELLSNSNKLNSTLSEIHSNLYHKVYCIDQIEIITAEVVKSWYIRENHRQTLKIARLGNRYFPNNIIILHILGNILAFLSTIENNAEYAKESIEFLEKAIKLDPALLNDENVMSDLGNSYSTLSNYAKTVDYFQKALLINPISSSGQYIVLGRAYEHLELIDDAIIIYEKGLQYYPHNIHLEYSLLILKIKKGIIVEKLFPLEEVLKQMGEDSEVYYYLGIGYYRLGENNKAKKALEKSILLGKNDNEKFLAKKFLEENKILN